MKNPKEYFWENEKKTFCVFNELCAPTCEDGSEPLSLHHETFSRLRFTIFNEEHRPVSANIPISEFPGIFNNVRNQILVSQILKKIGNNSQPANKGDVDTSSPAFTEPIASGKLKGKTPVGALLEDPANEELLKNQVSWLRSNMARYPKNAEKIAPIEEALKLYREGKLSGVMTAVAATPAKTIIYPGGLRPLVRRKRADGKAFVYTIEIAFYENSDKPIEFKITNFYAPVVTTSNGLFNVQVKDKSDELTVTFNMDLSKWAWLEHQTESQMRIFENVHGKTLYDKAVAADKENRLKARV